MLLPIVFFSLMISLIIVVNVPMIADSLPGLSSAAAALAVIAALAAVLLWRPQDKNGSRAKQVADNG